MAKNRNTPRGWQTGSRGAHRYVKNHLPQKLYTGIAGFADAIYAAGLGRPDTLSDGEIHRFHVDGDKAGSKNGWYILYTDGLPAGAFGSWKTGLTETWCSHAEKPSKDEYRRICKKIAASMQKRHESQHRRWEKVAFEATTRVLEAVEPLWHPYFKRKRILPLGIRQKDNLLVIPVRDVDGKLWSVQTIDPKGTKLFLAGGKVKGNFYLIGDPISNEMVICEGFATGASLHMYYGPTKHKPVAVAFYASNLKPAAKAIALRHGNAQITIAADNDRKTPGNPGLTAGRTAAAAVGGNLIYPTFDDEPFDGTDFNDLVNGWRVNNGR